MDESLPGRVILAPGGHELREVVRAQDGRVARQVVEAVRDHGHHDVQHDEGAEEDEGDEVQVGDGVAAALLRVDLVELPVLGVVPLVGHVVAGPARHRRHHDVRPRLARRAPESHVETTCSFFINILSPF